MRIEEGKFYRTRDGRKVGPMARHKYGWTADGGFRIYEAGGKRVLGFGTPEPSDLVAEWVEPAAKWFLDIPNSPIVTETVQRIKPGVYGPLEVTGEAVLPLRCGEDAPEEPVVYAALTPSYLCASDWRELARVALEIAEYLDAR